MENSSNNKQYIKSSPWFQGLLLPLLCCLFPFPSKAQSYFNRLYTLNADASEFHAIAPQGNDGGFMTAAATVDSISGNQGIRISRFSADGVEEKGTFFNLPDYPSRSMSINYKCIARINDNRYAISGTIVRLGSSQYSYVAIFDSNGLNQYYKEILIPKTAPGADTFMYTPTIQYDDLGHLLIASHIKTDIDTYHCVLQKFDTSLNEIWTKEYYPSGVFNRIGSYHLIVDKTGYLMCGGADNNAQDYYDGYKSHAMMIQTDTAGIQQWYYASPTDSIHKYYSRITSAVHTQDGGYLFVTTGDVYNTRPELTKPIIDLAGKTLIVKLDAARKKMWEIKVDSFYTRFGLRYLKLLELKDASFLLCGSVHTDSIAPNYIDGAFYLNHYTSNGALIYKHKLKPPKAVSDTAKASSGGILDFMQTVDKGFILCGAYYNFTKGAPAPIQRGWIIKLDSNGCLGAGDPECWPTSIAPINTQSKFTLNIFPNPSSNYYEVDYVNEDHSPTIISITDISGRALAQYPLPQGKSHIEAASWASGMYFYSIRQGSKTITKGKLLKQ